MPSEYKIVKDMLSKLREGKENFKNNKVQPLELKEHVKKENNFLQEAKDLMEKFENELEKKNLNEDFESTQPTTQAKEYVIRKNDNSFGDVRSSQEAELVKTIGQSIELDDNALIYYPQNKDLVLNGKITSMNLSFQFRYNDPTGDGCYIWANALQLTDTNSENLGKIRSAFEAWKQVLLQDADLMEKLYKTAVERN